MAMGEDPVLLLRVGLKVPLSVLLGALADMDGHRKR